MPLTHISLRTGKPDAYRQAICDAVGRALHDTFDVPDENEFMAITEHTAANFRYGPTYLGIARDDDVVFIQITVNNTRKLEQKKALFQRLAQLLAEEPGIRPENVFVNLVEVVKENWSLGNGIAQYA